MANWVQRLLTGGVVTTKSASSLRPEELVESRWCRLETGNPLELYPDRKYEELLPSRGVSEVLLCEMVTFDELDEQHLLIVYTTAQATSLNVWRLDTKAIAARTVIGEVATEACLVPRGAEYFIGMDVGNRILRVGSAGFLSFRSMGLDPPQTQLNVLTSEPFISSTVFNTVGPFGGIDAYTIGREIINDIYGRYGTSEDRRQALRQFRNSIFTSIPQVTSALGNWLEDYQPVTEVKIEAPGAAALALYWVTRYDSDLAVESGPSEAVEAIIMDPQALVITLKVDVNFLFLNWDELPIQDEASRLVLESEFERLQRFIETNGPEIKVTLEAPLRLRQARLASIGFTDPPQEGRLYRGLLSPLPDFAWVWDENGNFQTKGASTGSSENALKAVREGRRVLQGGLLSDINDSRSYSDAWLESGISDTVPAYPTVSYFDQGALGVYQYLQKPPNFVVGANIGQSLLMVPKDNRQVIRVTPVSDPENAPPIFAIPVVSENQDKIVAIETIRDTAIVLTSSACLRLNYIPFESSVQQDRVLTQISDFHGALGQRSVTTVETQNGQMVVWMSRTGIMATNGYGFSDMCPDFSVSSAGLDLAEAESWVLTNNYKEYRLELWAGGERWDFYYHPTLMKDVRGDGLGLSFKLMGPSPYFGGGRVKGADMGNVENVPTMMLAVQDGARFWVAQSTEQDENRAALVRTGVWWGSNPLTLVDVKGLGLQFRPGRNYPVMSITQVGQDVDGPGQAVSGQALKQNTVKGFGYVVPENQTGESQQHIFVWRGGPVGPAWMRVSEMSSGYGA